MDPTVKRKNQGKKQILTRVATKMDVSFQLGARIFFLSIIPSFYCLDIAKADDLFGDADDISSDEDENKKANRAKLDDDDDDDEGGGNLVIADKVNTVHF